MEQIISCEKIGFEYKGSDEDESVKVFKDLDFQVEKGSFVAILGHNGSGKSTLAKHFNAILLPVSGKIYINGMETTNEANLYEVRRSVGMVFQNPDNQIVATIVEEDVAFGLENIGIEPNEIRRRVDESLKTVNMFEYKDKAPHLLSGGQKQRIAIAGIIAMRPECIVLDEPTAMLDPRGRKEVMETLLGLNKEYGITIVLITHNMDEAVRAERVVVMDNGKIVDDGVPKAVFAKVENLKNIGLDVPQASELSWELNKESIGLPKDIIDIDECVKEISLLLDKKGVVKNEYN